MNTQQVLSVVDVKNWLNKKFEDERFFFGYNLFVLFISLCSIATPFYWIGILLAGAVLETNLLGLLIVVLQDRARMRQ